MTVENQTLTSMVKHKTAFGIMHLIMVLVPFLAGLDKFFNFITDWERYISPIAKPFVPMSSKNIMHCAGIAEMAIGLTTTVRPRFGSLIFAVMLTGIVLNLLTMKKQLHIASLDTCLASFALVFALLQPESKRA